MRADRALAAAALVCIVAAAGCAPHRLRTDVSGDYATPARHRVAPAPANPDLSTVMERFYQQVEGAHWPFAYAMLSRRYRARISQDRFVARYSAFGDLDVSLRQLGDRHVVATIGAKERGSAAPARRFEETTTLAWDGEGWTIDGMMRRDVSPAGMR